MLSGIFEAGFIQMYFMLNVSFYRIGGIRVVVEGGSEFDM
jgi:hypothetical protein